MYGSVPSGQAIAEFHEQNSSGNATSEALPPLRCKWRQSLQHCIPG
ncbi:MAG: hypothetical protein HC899_18420 [Leptolyngbyaceae cyanobacterium SM1_4_3]|nr:hypothetical protein [Leptolyngbyaceae cyanobacterium SM1_4_3]